MKFDLVDEYFFLLRSILYSLKLVNKDYFSLLRSSLASFGRGRDARSLRKPMNILISFLEKQTRNERTQKWFSFLATLDSSLFAEAY